MVRYYRGNAPVQCSGLSSNLCQVSNAYDTRWLQCKSMGHESESEVQERDWIIEIQNKNSIDFKNALINVSVSSPCDESGFVDLRECQKDAVRDCRDLCHLVKTKIDFSIFDGDDTKKNRYENSLEFSPLFYMLQDVLQAEQVSLNKCESMRAMHFLLPQVDICDEYMIFSKDFLHSKVNFQMDKVFVADLADFGLDVISEPCDNHALLHNLKEKVLKVSAYRDSCNLSNNSVSQELSKAITVPEHYGFSYPPKYSEDFTGIINCLYETPELFTNSIRLDLSKLYAKNMGLATMFSRNLVLPMTSSLIFCSNSSAGTVIPKLFPSTAKFQVDKAANPKERKIDSSKEDSNIPLSFVQLIADEILSDEDFFTLPPVFLPHGIEDLQVHNQLFQMDWKSVLPWEQAWNIQKMSGVAATALYLDWSLSISKEEFRSTEIIAACYSTKKEISFFPSRCSDLMSEIREGNKESTATGLFSILGHITDFGSELISPQQLKIATVFSKAGMITEDTDKHNPQSMEENDNNLNIKKKTMKQLDNYLGLRLLTNLHGREDVSQNLESKTECQEDKTGANHFSSWSDCSSSPDEFSNSYIKIPISGIYFEIFEKLKADDQKIMDSCYGLSHLGAILSNEHNKKIIPDFPTSEPLAILIEKVIGKSEAKDDFESMPTSLKSLELNQDTIRAIASMAILRQAASLLIHHGIRCASLFCSISLEEVPVQQDSLESVLSLRDASKLVDRGRILDSLKHEELRKQIIIVNALRMDAKILLIGDPKSFFTLYRIVQDAGMRPCHLDKDGSLESILILKRKSFTSAKTIETAIQESISQAFSIANVIMVSAGFFAKTKWKSSVSGKSYHEAEGDEIPESSASEIQNFCSLLLKNVNHIIVFATEEELKVPILQYLEPQDVPLTVFELANPRSSNCGSIGTNMGKPSPLVQPMQTDVNGVNQGQKKLSNMPAMDWPLVVNSNLDRFWRSHSIMEEILKLENEGTTVIERPLDSIDVILSPSAGFEFVMISMDDINLCFGARNSLNLWNCIYNKIFPSVQKASISIGVFHVILHMALYEPEFLPVLHSVRDKILMDGRALSLEIQLEISFEMRDAKASMLRLLRSYLQLWHQNLSNMYSIGDSPSSFEEYCLSCPSLNPHSAALVASSCSPDEIIKQMSLYGIYGLPTPVQELIPLRILQNFVRDMLQNRNNMRASAMAGSFAFNKDETPLSNRIEFTKQPKYNEISQSRTLGKLKIDASERLDPSIVIFPEIQREGRSPSVPGDFEKYHNNTDVSLYAEAPILDNLEDCSITFKHKETKDMKQHRNENYFIQNKSHCCSEGDVQPELDEFGVVVNPEDLRLKDEEGADEYTTPRAATWGMIQRPIDFGYDQDKNKNILPGLYPTDKRDVELPYISEKNDSVQWNSMAYCQCSPQALQNSHHLDHIEIYPCDQNNSHGRVSKMRATHDNLVEFLPSYCDYNAQNPCNKYSQDISPRRYRGNVIHGFLESSAAPFDNTSRKRKPYGPESLTYEEHESGNDTVDSIEALMAPSSLVYEDMAVNPIENRPIRFSDAVKRLQQFHYHGFHKTSSPASTRNCSQILSDEQNHCRGKRKKNRKKFTTRTFRQW